MTVPEPSVVMVRRLERVIAPANSRLFVPTNEKFWLRVVVLVIALGPAKSTIGLRTRVLDGPESGLPIVNGPVPNASLFPKASVRLSISSPPVNVLLPVMMTRPEPLLSRRIPPGPEMTPSN